MKCGQCGDDWEQRLCPTCAEREEIERRPDNEVICGGCGYWRTSHESGHCVDCRRTISQAKLEVWEAALGLATVARLLGNLEGLLVRIRQERDKAMAGRVIP